METSTQQYGKLSYSNPLLETLDIISIVQLDPSTAPPANNGITARVALVYPYSSSTETAGILAVDHDIRVRRNGGQIHVQFKDAAGRSVGASGIGIGDTIHLSLRGATWSEEQQPVKAPGKSVNGTLLYKSRLELQISRNETNFASLNVDEIDPAPQQKTPPASPKHLSDVTIGLPLGETPSWTSPAFLRNNNWSSSPFTGSFSALPQAFSDDFLDFDDRPKKRTKFWRSSGQWRYSGRSPSPPPSEVDAIDVQRQKMDGLENVAQTTPDAMEVDSFPSIPPVLPGTGQEQHEVDAPLPTEATAADELIAEATTKEIFDTAEPEVTVSVSATSQTPSRTDFSSPVEKQPESAVYTSMSEHQSKDQPPSSSPRIPNYDFHEQGEELSRPSLPQIDTSLEFIGRTVVLSANDALVTPTSPKLLPLESDILPIISPFSGLDQSSSMQQLLWNHDGVSIAATLMNQMATSALGFESDRDGSQALNTGTIVQVAPLPLVAEYSSALGSDKILDIRQSTAVDEPEPGPDHTSFTDGEYPDFGLDGASMSRPAPRLNTEGLMLQQDTGNDHEPEQNAVEDNANLKSSPGKDDSLSSSTIKTGDMPLLSQDLETTNAEPELEVQHETRPKSTSESPRSYHDAQEDFKAPRFARTKKSATPNALVTEQQAVPQTFGYFSTLPATQLGSLEDGDERRSTLHSNRVIQPPRIYSPPETNDLQGIPELSVLQTESRFLDDPVDISSRRDSLSANAMTTDTSQELFGSMESIDRMPLTAESGSIDDKEKHADASDDDVVMITQFESSAINRDFKLALSVIETSIDPSLDMEDSAMPQIDYTETVSSPPPSFMVNDDTQELPDVQDDGVKDVGFDSPEQLAPDEGAPGQTSPKRHTSAKSVLDQATDTSVQFGEPAMKAIGETVLDGDILDNAILDPVKVTNIDPAIATQPDNPESTYSSWTLGSNTAEQPREPQEVLVTASKPDDVEMIETSVISVLEEEDEVYTEAESSNGPDELMPPIQAVLAVESYVSVEAKNDDRTMEDTESEALSTYAITKRTASQSIGIHAPSTPFSSLDISQGLMETLVPVTDVVAPLQLAPGPQMLSPRITANKIEEVDTINILQVTSQISNIAEDTRKDEQPEENIDEGKVEVAQLLEQADTLQSHDQSGIPEVVSPVQKVSSSRSHKRKSSVPAILSSWFDSSNIIETTQVTTEPNMKENFPNLQASQIEHPVAEVDLPQSRPRRRSARLRKSSVPEVLSGWFESRDGAGKEAVHDDTSKQDDAPSVITPRKPQNNTTTAMETQTPNSANVAQQNPSTLTMTMHGNSETNQDESVTSLCSLRSTLSYYYALDSLTQLLNSAPLSTDNIVDVIAVVTWQSKKPKKSKAGPKDQFTILHIAQPPKLDKSTEVHVFRPSKDALPVAEKGDVILLRNFTVKSRARECYLLSESSSAWHVWRFRRVNDDTKQNKMPGWAQSKEFQSILEETKGPPVELGSEEQDHARNLRSWYEELQTQKSNS